MIICGILRSGGDTVYSTAIDSTFNMGVQVPLAFIGVLLLEWPLAWIMAFVSISDFAKVFILFRRYYSKKWMTVLTGKEETS